MYGLNREKSTTTTIAFRCTAIIAADMISQETTLRQQFLIAVIINLQSFALKHYADNTSILICASWRSPPSIMFAVYQIICLL
jgi:hypothetical protein